MKYSASALGIVGGQALALEIHETRIGRMTFFFPEIAHRGKDQNPGNAADRFHGEMYLHRQQPGWNALEDRRITKIVWGTTWVKARSSERS